MTNNELMKAKMKPRLDRAKEIEQELNKLSDEQFDQLEPIVKLANDGELDREMLIWLLETMPHGLHRSEIMRNVHERADRIACRIDGHPYTVIALYDERPKQGKILRVRMDDTPHTAWYDVMVEKVTETGFVGFRMPYQGDPKP